MDKVFIIDGYNLLHRGYSQVAASVSLEEARRHLERRLRAFRALEPRGTSIIVVFDGTAPHTAASSARRALAASEGFSVRYSSGRQSADDLVIELCREHGQQDDVCAVSSDVDGVARRARDLGCAHLPSETFAEMVEARVSRRGRRTSSRPVREKPASEAPDEVDRWLRTFGYHPEEDSW